MKTTDLSPAGKKYVAGLAKDDLGSLLELSCHEQDDPHYQREYALSYDVAQWAGARLSKFPKQLRSSAQQRKREQERRNTPIDPAEVELNRAVIEAMRRVHEYRRSRSARNGA